MAQTESVVTRYKVTVTHDIQSTLAKTVVEKHLEYALSTGNLGL